MPLIDYNDNNLLVKQKLNFVTTNLWFGNATIERENAVEGHRYAVAIDPIAPNGNRAVRSEIEDNIWRWRLEEKRLRYRMEVSDNREICQGRIDSNA